MLSVSESYRYIVRSAGVRSGNPTVENTRIGVPDLIGLLQNGEPIDTQLTRSHVRECLADYEDHRGEIDLLAARQMARPRSEVPARSRRTRRPELLDAATCRSNSAALLTCNRDDFLRLTATMPHHGIVIVIRRGTRDDERAALLRLIERAGEIGLENDVNFA